MRSANAKIAFVGIVFPVASMNVINVALPIIIALRINPGICRCALVFFMLIIENSNLI